MIANQIVEKYVEKIMKEIKYCPENIVVIHSQQVYPKHYDFTVLISVWWLDCVDLEFLMIFPVTSSTNFETTSIADSIKNFYKLVAFLAFAMFTDV